MRNQSTPSSTTIPFVPWENGTNQNQQYHVFEHREYRRRLAGAVRTLLHRQNRAYHRRINQLQEQWHQQQQQQMKIHQSAPSGFMENEDVIRLTVDLPGINKDDIQIQVIPSPLQYELRITGKRSYMSIDSTSCVSTNTKSQRYCINHNVVDVSQINATLHNGVLTVTAPKKKAILTAENTSDMDTGKDHSTPQIDMNNDAPAMAESNNDVAVKPPPNEEVERMNAIINIAVSEE
jgi:HSP20 family molecular chaperone IbpA